MSSSNKAKRSTSAASAAKQAGASTATAAPPALRTAPAVSPLGLFVSGDALAAHRLARTILADEGVPEPQKAEARALLDHCALDRPTLGLFAVACLTVLSILSALYLF